MVKIDTLCHRCGRRAEFGPFFASSYTYLQIRVTTDPIHLANRRDAWRTLPRWVAASVWTIDWIAPRCRNQAQGRLTQGSYTAEF